MSTFFATDPLSNTILLYHLLQIQEENADDLVYFHPGSRVARTDHFYIIRSRQNKVLNDDMNFTSLVLYLYKTKLNQIKSNRFRWQPLNPAHEIPTARAVIRS